MNSPRLYRAALRTSTRTAYTSTTPSTAQPPLSSSAGSSPAHSVATPAGWQQQRFPVSDLRTLRPFSTSTARLASEAPKSHYEQRGWQSEKPLFERLQQHPEAFAAIEDLAKLIQRKTGVSLQSGEPPSMGVMMALVRDPEMRQAAEKLMRILRESGIEIDPQAAFKALQMMGGQGFEGNMEVNALHEAMRKGEGSDEGDGNDKGKK
ncbi:hypothetical protein OIO90_002255 [Microbotryomycetes sp. JL221]|nr:hypothetical protein OIO90_002255 [Microbotryomycetes sp. JL221]